MKIHMVEQNTAEWYALRLGIPTASDFHKIVTPAKGDYSTQARAYAHYLLAEELLRRPLGSISHLEHIAHGKKHEPEAVKQYEFVREVTTTAVGFVTTDDGMMGCSPDRFVEDGEGVLEVKCPAPQTHVGYLLDGPQTDYRPQVQGQLMICEREWVDFYSYHPDMPPVLLRITRDEPYIARLAAALRQFNDTKAEMRARVVASGFFDARPTVQTPVDQMAEELV